MHHEHIREKMEVVSSDGKQVGTVDHMEGEEFVKLSKKGPGAGGKHHLIPVDWIDHVDDKVHLNKSAVEAVAQWRTAA